jgi:mannose-6-phosphate isomerase-like protein (cupin superfamily)
MVPRRQHADDVFASPIEQGARQMADYTVARFDELEGFYNGIFRKARAALGVTAFGLSIVEIPEHSVHYPEHNHPSGQEEVLIVLKGSGRLILDEGAEHVDLEPDMMVRIGPATKRTIRVGDEGMRLVAIGGIPGQGYEAPAFTELGALDPLLKRPGS